MLGVWSTKVTSPIHGLAIQILHVIVTLKHVFVNYNYKISIVINKPKIIIGLGQKATEYRSLSKYLDIVQVDWNNGSLAKMKLGNPDILVGFSLGCVVATMHAEKHKVKNLILCSPTPDETLERVKTDYATFIVGEKETWLRKETRRVAKTLKCPAKIIIVPGSDHKIDSKYQKALLEVLNIKSSK